MLRPQIHTLRTALFAAPLLLLAALPARAAAQTELTVFVADTSSGQPVSGAIVTVAGTRGETNTAGETVFHAVPAGPVTIEARRIGYANASVPVTVASGAQRVNVALAIDAVVLRRLHVTGAGSLPHNPLLRDFYIRKATWGSGYFLTRDDFGRDGHRPFTEAMRRIPSVNISTDATGRTQIRFNKNVPMAVGSDCAPVVYLDGNRFGQVQDFDTEFQGLQIEGVEVYSGARIPPQFNGGDAGCGVLVVWSRRSLVDNQARLAADGLQPGWSAFEGGRGAEDERHGGPRSVLRASSLPDAAMGAAGWNFATTHVSDAATSVRNPSTRPAPCAAFAPSLRSSRCSSPPLNRTRRRVRAFVRRVRWSGR